MMASQQLLPQSFEEFINNISIWHVESILLHEI